MVLINLMSLFSKNLFINRRDQSGFTPAVAVPYAPSGLAYNYPSTSFLSCAGATAPPAAAKAGSDLPYSLWHSKHKVQKKVMAEKKHDTLGRISRKDESFFPLLTSPLYSSLSPQKSFLGEGREIFAVPFSSRSIRGKCPPFFSQEILFFFSACVSKNVLCAPKDFLADTWPRFFFPLFFFRKNEAASFFCSFVHLCNCNEFLLKKAFISVQCFLVTSSFFLSASFFPLYFFFSRAREENSADAGIYKRLFLISLNGFISERCCCCLLFSCL